ncbi:unnamed protein product, partial [Rotaria sp. Silwood2]
MSRRPPVASQHQHQHQQKQKSSYDNQGYQVHQGHQGHYCWNPALDHSNYYKTNVSAPHVNNLMAVNSPRRAHPSTDDEISEHEDFNNDPSVKIVQNTHKRPRQHSHNHNLRSIVSGQKVMTLSTDQLDSTTGHQQQITTAASLSTNNNDLLTPEAERFAQTRYPFPPFILRFPLVNVKEQKVAEELCKYLNDNKQIHLELIGYRRSKLKCGLNESDILLFVKDSLSFSFLYDDNNWPTTLLGSSFTRPYPTSIPPQLSLMVKGVGLAIDFDNFILELKTKFTSLMNIIRIKNKEQQDTKLVKLEFSCPQEREDLLHCGKVFVSSLTFPVEEYLAQARVLICSKCCGIGHFRRQCQQNKETCKKCGQMCDDIKQHFIVRTQIPRCIHCGGGHMSNDMKCIKVKQFRADLTRRLLSTAAHASTSTVSNPNYHHNQADFPQLGAPQRPYISSVQNGQKSDIVAKLDQMNDNILKLNETIEKLSMNSSRIEARVEQVIKSNEELSRQVVGLTMDNKIMKSRINEHEDLLKNILLPFCQDLIKFCREKNTKQGRHNDEALHSHLELYSAQL